MGTKATLHRCCKGKYLKNCLIILIVSDAKAEFYYENVKNMFKSFCTRLNMQKAILLRHNHMNILGAKELSLK